MFNKSRFIFYLKLLILVFLCLFGGSVNAANDTGYYAPQLNVQIPGLDFTESPIAIEGNYVTIPFLATYIYAFFKYSVGIALIAAAIMFIYGGFLYLLSSTGIQVQDAKQKMVDAIVGMTIFLGAYVVVANVNPNLIQFSGLRVLQVQEDLWGTMYPDSSIEDMVGVSSAGSGMPGAIVMEGQDRGANKGCVVNPKFKVAKAVCNTMESCGCNTNNYPTAEGYPKLSELANLKEIADKSPEEQIYQHGLYFPKRGGGAYLIPEAKEALINAGEIAKKQGYFIYVPVTTRTLESHIKSWCQRMKTEGNPQGLTPPGSSPHNLGLAVDVNLARLEDNSHVIRSIRTGRDNKDYLKVNNKFPTFLTPGGPICKASTNRNQVDATVSMGIENSVILQKIMADTGWRRTCSEMWHFNYSGVYSIDCTECAFPPQPEHRDMKNCKPQYRN